MIQDLSVACPVLPAGSAPGKYSRLVVDTRAAIKANKMLLVTQASVSARARRQGITIPGNHVMGVYRNDYARRMLAASIAASIEAPTRFYIMENTDGSTHSHTGCRARFSLHIWMKGGGA